MLNSLSQKAFSVLPGLGLVVAIAAASHLLSLGHTALDPLVLAMLASIMVGNLFGIHKNLGPRPLLAAFLGWIVIITLFVLGVMFIR
ncbi:MAG: hypothetical protein AABZ10_06030 [Nitrospirota bacterium]